MALKEWNELPLRVKRNRKNLYNYLKAEINGETDSDIVFTITDGTNELKGATVKVGSKTATTNAAGECTIKDVEYDSALSVEVSKTGYKTKTTTVNFSASATSFTIAIDILRTVSITVNDGTDPIEGASVVIDETTKTTGSAGGCTFSLADGIYSASVTKEGYEDETVSITVASDSTSATISLTAVTVEETTPGAE